MLAQLSSTSPYVCDLNRGPIEPANRMASAPSNKATALLENKESLPKHIRAPLKLLAPDEVPMDTTTAPTDANASLQLVWYTEQTIVDEQLTHNEDVASIIQEQQRQNKSTLPPIPSESPLDSDAIEELPNQPSLMHKSSTFTIEAAMNADSPLNDSEKENLVKDDAPDAVIPPSDDSFRALEQLLGLGSGATVRESPKTNHDTLSLTVVTPTDIINSTRRSSRLSYAQKGGAGSLPSSQEIPTMDPIESIASANPPSFLADNTTMEEEQPSLVSAASQLTSFDVTEVDTVKDDSNTDDETNFSFELNDFPNNSNDEPKVTAPVVAQPMPAMRAPTCADVAYRALVKPRTGGRISQPVKADSPLAKPSKARSSAPLSRGLRSSTQCATTTELAPSPSSMEQNNRNPVFVEEAALTNPEESVSRTELVEIVTLPEEDENEQDRTAAVTLNVTSVKPTEESNATVEDEPDELTTPPKAIAPILSREYTFDSPKRRSAHRRRSTMNSLYATPTQADTPATIAEEEAASPSIASNSMLEILMTKPTQQAVRKTSILPSPVRLSKKQQAVSSPSIASQSMLGVLLTKPTASSPRATRKVSAIASPVRTSKRSVTKQLQAVSPSIASQSMLEVLLTKPTEVRTSTRTPKRNTTVNQAAESPAIASQSMLEVLLTKPSQVTPRNSRRAASATSSARSTGRNTLNVPMTESPTVASKSMLGILLTNATDDNSTVVPETPVAPSPLQTSARRSRRSSSHPTPRVSINPLHSSTPSSSRHKPLQLVNIGEEEQLTTTVPQQVNIEIHRDETDVEMASVNDTTVSVQQPSTFEIGVQTTPSLDRSMRRQLNQSAVTVDTVHIEEQQQITPLQTKVIVNLQRSVRFDLTPSTDARLVAKEKMEETLRGLKPDIVIQPAPLKLESQPEQTAAAPARKRGRPRKVLVSKKKNVTPKKKAAPKPKPVQTEPRAARNAKVVKKEEALPAKRTARKQAPVEATKKPAAKQAPAKRPTKAIAKRAAPKAAAKRIAKRTAEKRTMPTAVLESIVEHAAPKATAMEAKPEPVAKQPAQKPKLSKAKRAASKQAPEETPVEQTSTKRIAPETTAAPVAKRTKTAKLVEAPAPRLTSRRERKVPAKIVEAALEPATVTKKASKRRMPSAEKASEPAPKVEKKVSEVAQPIEKTAPKAEVQSKMDGLTVAQLKSRLTKQKQDIPKTAKKADLIALLLKLETNAVQEPEVAAPTTKTTRRRQN